jgi:hypothetical protein
MAGMLRPQGEVSICGERREEAHGSELNYL